MLRLVWCAGSFEHMRCLRRKVLSRVASRVLRMLPGSDGLIVPHGGCPTECPAGESSSTAGQVV